MVLRGRHQFSRGFTLAELVITIAVIVILATITAVAYTGVQKQANDAEREGDVTAIMSALEKYYEEHGEYPANDEINTTNTSENLASFDATKALMPSLRDEDLIGPDNYRFYAGCMNTVCNNTSENWETYRTKQYVYSSRLLDYKEDTYVYFQTGIGYGNGTGWGCSIRTYYNDPGYFIAWRREADGIWVFKRSNRGIVEITDYGAGPVAPQTCTFS